MPEERTAFEAAALGRAWRRVAHEIFESTVEGKALMLVGIQRGGVQLARLMGDSLASLYGHEVMVGSVEPGLHRDDLSQRGMSELRATELPADLSDQVVVLVDDVLCSGRTVRAAMDALLEFGRPYCIRLAVLIDRGHRELPIRPDFVGKNLPSKLEECVEVRCDDAGSLHAVILPPS
mgnify:CR=1 FL=1